MGKKWFLRDWSNPQRIVKGTLTDVHRADDGDTNLMISPASDDANQGLLSNRDGGVNEDGFLECEINLGSDWKDQYEDWARSLVSTDSVQIEVTAQGVYVDDDDHASKTELHPLDFIFGPVTASLIPGDDWIGTLAAERGLTVGDSLFAFRFAAASDGRYEGTGADEHTEVEQIFQQGPPLAQWSRAVGVSLPLPPPTPGATIGFEHREVLAHNASDLDPDPGLNSSGELTVSFTCDGRDYGGPGVILGEIVTFWVSATIPRIVLSPQELSFGNVAVNSSATLNLRIANVGPVDLIISVSPPAVHLPFSWETLVGTTIAPGGTLDFSVDFNPPGIGIGHGTLVIQSNAPGSPHQVPLTGIAVKGNPQ